MPIFDYRCTNCSAIYDVLHKGKEMEGDIVCPRCGSHKYIKLISLPSVITKGASSVRCDRNSCGMESSCCGDGCLME